MFTRATRLSCPGSLAVMGLETAGTIREYMFDDDSGCEPGLDTDDRLDPDEQHVYEYVHEYGPIATASLQADLFPYDWRTFARTLRSLVRGGYLSARENRVAVAVELGGPVGPWTVEVSGLDRALTLRHATPADLSSITELARTVGEHGTADVPDRITRPLEAEHTHRQQSDGWRVVLVADLDGRVSGWANLWAVEDRERAAVTGAVARDVRRKGIGSHLHEYALAWAGEAGYRRVTQSVPADDVESFQFLRTRGWSVEGVTCSQDGASTGGEGLRLVTELD